MFTGVIIPLLRVYLTIVLGVAGCAKLARPAGIRITLSNVGLPDKAVVPVAVLVPVVEVILAAGLWMPGAIRWAALATAVMFGFFAVLGYLFRSRQIRCNCFGSLTDDTLGMGTVFRNLPLVLMALVVVRYPAAGWGGTPLEFADAGLTATGLFLIEPVVRAVWR